MNNILFLPQFTLKILKNVRHLNSDFFFLIGTISIINITLEWKSKTFFSVLVILSQIFENLIDSTVTIFKMLKQLIFA